MLNEVKHLGLEKDLCQVVGVRFFAALSAQNDKFHVFLSNTHLLNSQSSCIIIFSCCT